jgi:hypothetical protein
MSRDDEIADVRWEEERRGRRPIDLEAHRRRRTLLRKFREALRSGNEEIFRHAIISVLGQLPGTPEFEQSMKVWREFHGGD